MDLIVLPSAFLVSGKALAQTDVLAFVATWIYGLMIGFILFFEMWKYKSLTLQM